MLVLSKLNWTSGTPVSVCEKTFLNSKFIAVKFCVMRLQGRLLFLMVCPIFFSLHPLVNKLSRVGSRDVYLCKHSLDLLMQQEPTLFQDGMAIAGAVLHQLATHTLPLTFFATHYGSLTDDFAYHPNIRNMHMSTLVDDEKKEVFP